jgi:hypothetical protein
MEKLDPNTGVVDSRNVFGILHNAASRSETYAWDKGTFGLPAAAKCRPIQ